eukprot:TRINITY_DN6666_c0_g1_i4.p1 TRINITY_DN6666_c0_g1~~TRINITY_DN6666_c0_g1_i4.p1  ORF type:complete len:424 (+),score=87.80 TRINITY_DN6666_c0_g1_i4:169-1440(+)
MAALSAAVAAVPPARGGGLVLGGLGEATTASAGRALRHARPADESVVRGADERGFLGMRLAAITAVALPAALVANERRKTLRKSRAGRRRVEISSVAGGGSLERSRIARQAVATEVEVESVGSDVDADEVDDMMDDQLPPPEDLYELLGIAPGVDMKVVKQAYYRKMKVCHPDIAGDAAEEMCILLNDAYAVLSDPQSRDQYDEQIMDQRRAKYALESPSTRTWQPPEVDDIGPTWKWTAKAVRHDTVPEYLGQPFSRSLWDRRQFVFVDEFKCICCRNCCDIAPKTFCIDFDTSRARVYAQWGNNEEYLEYAVMSCPVDCISWVSRPELQALEYVTRKAVYDVGGQMPCPMMARQGNMGGQDVPNVFVEASELRQRVEEEHKERLRKGSMAVKLAASAQKLQLRMARAFKLLGAGLQRAGWA